MKANPGEQHGVSVPAFPRGRYVATTVLLFSLLPVASAQDKYTLVEKFDSATTYRVEQRTELTGQITLTKKDQKPETLALVGQGKVTYDERVLPNDDAETQRVIRQYRGFEYRRQIGDRDQQANLRKDIYRLIVLRSAKGKSPFSPEGPLLWSEIDAVRHDVFSPVLVPAILPTSPVAVGDTWKLDTAGVLELTDLEKVTAGGFTLKLLGVVTLNGRKQARLSLTGSASGIDDNGPCKHTLDGTAYFDLDANRLSYLSLKGTHELQDGSGKTVGTIEGRFTINRSASPEVSEFSEAALKNVELKPTAENSLLLYDNPDLGVRFLYPRRWRVGAVQGRQLTLDGPNGAGILLTVETAKSLPTANDFLKETSTYLKKSTTDTVLITKPTRVSERPLLDRFALTATMKQERVRMEYAVLTNADGTGATFSARLPAADAEELVKDVERVLKSLAAKK